jgi:hypothetical protein
MFSFRPPLFLPLPSATFSPYSRDDALHLRTAVATRQATFEIEYGTNTMLPK